MTLRMHPRKQANARTAGTAQSMLGEAVTAHRCLDTAHASTQRFVVRRNLRLAQQIFRKIDRGFAGGIDPIRDADVRTARDGLQERLGNLAALETWWNLGRRPGRRDAGSW